MTKPDSSTQAVVNGGSLPTEAGGSYTLSVTAVDVLGGTRRLTRTYTVTAPGPPVNVLPPTIAGTPVVGQTLTASLGSWTGPIGFFLYEYQWQRCNAGSCVDIPAVEGGSGVTSFGSTTRVVTPADRGTGAVGNTLRIRVTVTTNLGSASATGETQPVKFAPELPGFASVVINGVLKEGETLFQGFNPPILILFPDYELLNQWYRCPSEGSAACQPISGATSYTLTSADVGSRIKVSLQLKSYSIFGPVYESAVSDQVVDSTSMTINDVTRLEGDEGTTSYEFTVTRSGPLADPSKVHYETADGSATTADNDYEHTSGDVEFAAGETSKPVQVTVNGDTTIESNDDFFVNLSNPINATILDGQGQGTIQNDDALVPPTSATNTPSPVQTGQRAAALKKCKKKFPGKAKAKKRKKCKKKANLLPV